jgi:hypothetical protein
MFLGMRNNACAPARRSLGPVAPLFGPTLAAAMLAAIASAALGCHRGGVGASCNDARDCEAGLLCDPQTGRCETPPGGTDSGPPGDSAVTGTDATAADSSTSTDASPPGTDAVPPGTDSAPPGTDAGGAVDFCSATTSCSPTQICQVALCSMMGEGFCTEPTRPTCGGFTGTLCPTGMGYTCLDQGTCVADASGICVTAAERMAICATQMSLWACP